MEPEARYFQLGELISEMPTDLAGPGDISAATRRWLGRAAMLIDDGHQRVNVDLIHFTSACDSLVGVGHLRERNANQIQTIVYRALARAETNAPAGAQGAFIGAGNAFEVIQAVAKVLLEATNNIFIVDPYMDATVLTHFAIQANEGIRIRLLADKASTDRGTMQPAVERWIAQYAAARALEMPVYNSQAAP
jgi:hypothetical protein